MKINEIIDFDPRDSKETTYSYKSKIRAAGGKPAGSGSFSTVFSFDSPKRYNQISKIGRTGSIGQRDSSAKKIEDDAFLFYIKSIQGSDNPYFPKISDLKIFKDNNGNLSYRANIHKYVDFQSKKIADNIDLIKSLYEDMFYGNIENDTYAIITLEDSLHNMFTDEKIIKDDNLKNAVQLIKQMLSKNPNFNLDIHSGNLMWKITGNRPQLVIIDPIA